MYQWRIYHVWNACGVIFLVSFLLAFLTDTSWPILVGGGLFLAATFLFQKYFRCPHCKKFVHPRDAHETFCPHCGKQIN